MCGICGYINLSNDQLEASVLHNMVNTMHHRGPDSQGYYEDQEDQVFLGHARLSIIDISDSGKQPMYLDNLTIVLNGEVYNYREIKEELISKGHSFKSSSDTEVVLHAYQEWGVDCVSRFIGMYAFAIYNSDSQIITLFRDRAGVKPLYYYFDGQSFIFGSELKVFHQNPLFKKELDFDALGLYMKFGYIPTPYCVFKNTHKLGQGSYLVFDIKKVSYEIHRYWDLKSFYLKPKLNISYEEALEETERIMISSFQYRMVADVPVGVFLSAGFDSTCVAALLQKGMTDKLRTFTIGFESGNNEAPMAKEIAHYLGTDHSEHYCSEEDALRIVKDLPYYYDEPFADSSAIPTTLVSQIAREQVKVALSADGGDEIFAGYNSYDSYMRGFRLITSIPSFFKRPVGHLTRIFNNLVSDPISHRRLNVITDVLLSDKKVAFSLSESIHDNNPSGYIGTVFTKEADMLQTVYDDPNDEMTVLSRLLFADYMQYMPDDILVKVDRASMSTSLEGRNPLLDHRIVEFAAQLPDEYKYCDGVKKRILKDVVYKYVPKGLMDKPKTGFSVPLDRWIDDGLRESVDYFFAEEQIKRNEVFNIDFAKKTLNAFRSKNKTLAPDVWKILQLQMWCELWMK